MRFDSSGSWIGGEARRRVVVNATLKHGEAGSSRLTTKDQEPDNEAIQWCEEAGTGAFKEGNHNSE
ncbi:hypothetical protein HID58_019472 [Brassica napus]|uniref:Uncharacterized protein n=2 Tax=Brassica TaxID=3705 RepID=A0ABQ8DFJ9_BRANA|nr:hypothetical protein HID58_090782 [Brassica napus]KAH0927216.1 hypothetical protein HID58_019472 [Brassica napus]